MAADPGNPSATKEVSRRHKITLNPSGLLSITGGKWTSYRRMAEETIDRGIKAGILPKIACTTRKLRLLSDGKPLNKGRLRIYGDGAEEIESMITDNQSLGEKLHPDLPYTKAEIVWICRNEMPVKAEDILARRTRALFLDAKASINIAPEVIKIMADEMGYDKEWQEEQLTEYKNLVMNYL